MKSGYDGVYFINQKSHPARGAWIEMDNMDAAVDAAKESHPARGAWIEIP